MDWGMVIASFIGTFTANIIVLAGLFYFVWPKIRKAMNPLGNMFGSDE
jgi:uncharacterized membrane protein